MERLDSRLSLDRPRPYAPGGGSQVQGARRSGGARFARTELRQSAACNPSRLHRPLSGKNAMDPFGNTSWYNNPDAYRRMREEAGLPSVDEVATPAGPTASACDEVANQLAHLGLHDRRRASDAGAALASRNALPGLGRSTRLPSSAAAALVGRESYSQSARISYVPEPPPDSLEYVAQPARHSSAYASHPPPRRCRPAPQGRPHRAPRQDLREGVRHRQQRQGLLQQRPLGFFSSQRGRLLPPRFDASTGSAFSRARARPQRDRGGPRGRRGHPARQPTCGDAGPTRASS